MNIMKGQKDMTLEDKPPRLEDVQYATGEKWRQLPTAPVRMKWLGQSGNDAQMWMCLVVKVKPDSIKNNIA